MKKQNKLRRFGKWLGLRAPFIALIVLFYHFAFGGSALLKDIYGLRIAAGLFGLLQLVTLIRPMYRKAILFADLLTIVWFVCFSWKVYIQLYPDLAGPFSVAQPLTIAIFVAFSAPLRAHIYRAKRSMRFTHHYGENLRPHFPDVRKWKGGV